MSLRPLIALAALFLAESCLAVDRWQSAGGPLLDASLSEHLTLSADGKSLELTRGVLVEDDGPSAGYSYLPNVEKLDDKTAIRKQLVVDDPRTDSVSLLVGMAKAGELMFEINGKPQTLELLGKVGNYWDHYRVPTAAIRAGTNDIVIRGTGQVYVARDDERPIGDSPPPNRSAKSIDGGKTWNDARLGTKDETDGEYYVRLFLDRHVGSGWLITPVVDQANLLDKPLAPPLAKPGPVHVEVTADAPSDAQLKVSARTGTTLAVDETNWTPWQPLTGLKAVIAEPKGRFVQIRVEASTVDPHRSPKIHSIAVAAEPQFADDWTAQAKLTQVPTVRLARSSIPFEFEAPDHPRLQELRKLQKLDEVVAGAKNEFEKITKLAAWSGTQWQKRTGHLGTYYPKWDALDILRKHDDGTPIGGFCQQYNLVFLQACASFGIRGRPVSLSPGVFKSRLNGGHEVVELWSNDYRKWVHVDGDAARYYVDAKTRTPLSLRELHDRQVLAMADKPYDAVEAVVLAETRPTWGGLTAEPPFAELKMIPRSNLLAKPEPVPLHQGMRGWPWPGHAVWTDPLAPPAQLYDYRITAKNNWEWSLNEVEMRLAATETPGEVRVYLDTVTPGFTGYFANFDEADAVPVESDFTWVLHRGVNRLAVQARNETGDGPATVTILERAER
jgi:hypothetical protein